MARPVRTRIAARRSGQALVEFALVVPLLLILLLGVVEFGRAWNAYQVVTDAAREGARIAAVSDATGLTVDSVTNTVRNAIARAGLQDSATISVAGFRAGRGTPTTVDVSYPYRFTFLGPLLKWTTSASSVTLQTSFVMRNE